KSHAPHRTGQSDFREVPARALEGLNERTAHEDGADRRQLQAICRGAEGAGEQRANLGALFHENRQRFRDKPGLREGLEPLVRPRDVLKHSHRESSRFDVDHSGVMYAKNGLHHKGHDGHKGRSGFTFASLVSLVLKDLDVAIVGAGPAGSWAAYHLARRGARVTIFDPSHPREKPCGGGVTCRALALVADALTDASLPASTVRRARFVDRAAGGSAVVPLGAVPLADTPALVVARRATFDAALLESARLAGAT